MAAVVEAVGAQKDAWAQMPVQGRLRLLGEMLEVFRQMDHEAWARDALAATGYEGFIPDGAVATEMIMNTSVIGRDLETLADTYIEMAANGGKPPAVPVRADAASKQAIASVFPRTLPDRAGPNRDWKVEVWMEGESASQGACTARKQGRLCALLGAGNQGMLAVADALHLLFVEGMVCVVKHNPVRAYNHAWVERLFAPLVGGGFFASVVGGVPEAQALLRAPAVDHVHMTGGKATHDAIVWGSPTGPRETNVLGKPMTSELGAVTPWLIGPGEWTDEEVEHHAGYLATCLMNNNSCNCNAPQVLFLPADGFPRQKFLGTLKAIVRARPHAAPYYPGTRERHAAWVEGLAAAKEGLASTELVESAVPMGPPGRFGAPLPWAVSEVEHSIA